jgi:hypothetical protein
MPRGYKPTLAPVIPARKRNHVSSSPTKRTLELLRKEGFTAAVVERWNGHARIRQDLFGCIDVVAVHPARPGVLGIQCTTTANQAARLTKALAVPELQVWLAAGNAFEIWGWKKSRRTGRWEVSRTPVAQTRRK